VTVADRLGEEAVRLVAAVQDWARERFPAGPDGHRANSGAECQWCPLCQLMAVVRGERPEVTARVAEAGTALAAAFRSLVDAAAAATAAPEPDDQRSAGPAPRVQRVDLGEPES
jgi:hypothetical protein